MKTISFMQTGKIFKCELLISHTDGRGEFGY
jgi:hypothetical protein